MRPSFSTVFCFGATHPAEKSQFIRILRWVGELVLIMIAIGVMVACMGNTPAAPDNATTHAAGSEKPTIPPATPTAGLDFSTTRLSDNGLFRVSYVSSANVIPVNQVHQWTLHVETADGELVENATITVDAICRNMVMVFQHARKLQSILAMVTILSKV